MQRGKYCVDLDVPNMCMNSSFATFLCRKWDCSSRIAVRIMALSLAMTARSSAAVLHALTFRMRSRNFRDILKYFCFGVMDWSLAVVSMTYAMRCALSQCRYLGLMLQRQLQTMKSDLRMKRLCERLLSLFRSRLCLQQRSNALFGLQQISCWVSGCSLFEVAKKGKKTQVIGIFYR